MSVSLHGKPLKEYPLAPDILSPSQTVELTSVGNWELLYGQPGRKPFGSSLCSSKLVRIVSSTDGREHLAPRKEV